MRKRVSPRTSAGNGSSERFGRRGRRQLQNRRGPRRSRLPGAEQQVPLLDLSRAHGGGDPRTARRAAQTVLRRHAPLLRLAAGSPRRGVPRQRRRGTLGNGRKTDPRTTALERHHGQPGGRGPLLRRHETGGSGADRRIQGIGGGGDRGGPNRRTHRRPHDPRRFPLHRHERHHARHQGAAA